MNPSSARRAFAALAVAAILSAPAASAYAAPADAHSAVAVGGTYLDDWGWE